MDGLPINETLEDWQPHQSRRKAAVPSRHRAMVNEGLPGMRTPGLRMDQAKRLNELEKENGRLNRLLADAELNKAILREAAPGKF